MEKPIPIAKSGTHDDLSTSGCRQQQCKQHNVLHQDQQYPHLLLPCEQESNEQRQVTHKTKHMMAKRNARERQRVKAVNLAFSRLRRHIPYENKGKRLSKMKTLRIAIDYIRLLQSVLGELDSGVSPGSSASYRALLALARSKEAPPCFIWHGGGNV
uniref:BHLH domain-containing protein n=1 Tax=Macrostomum lignano TaxID=282301 RepID=A0A1I8GJU2_9PLAT